MDLQKWMVLIKSILTVESIVPIIYEAVTRALQTLVDMTTGYCRGLQIATYLS